MTTKRSTRYLGKHMLVFDDVFVGGDQHVELAAAQLRDEGSSSSRRPLNTHMIIKPAAWTTNKRGSRH